MTVQMADSIESPQTTKHPVPQLIRRSPVVGGYNGGNSWPTYPLYKAIRPDLPDSHVVSIVLHPSHFGRCLDIESGGAVTSDAPGWIRSPRADRSHGKPWLYTFASNVQAVINACSAAGIARDEYYIWAAHFTMHPHVCTFGLCGYPPADGTQYSDKGAENCDLSLLNNYMVDTRFYERYDTRKRIVYGRASELSRVKEYDVLRATQTPNRHPHRARITVLRAYCRAGAARIWAVSHTPGLGGFSKHYRGWRFQQLRHRVKGQSVT